MISFSLSDTPNLKNEVLLTLFFGGGGYVHFQNPHQALAEAETWCVDELWEKKSRSQF